MCSGVTTISPTATLSFAANPTAPHHERLLHGLRNAEGKLLGTPLRTPRMDSCNLVIYFLLENLAPAVPQDGWTAQTPLDYTRLVAGVARQVSLAGIAGIARESPIGPEFCDEMDSDLKETRRVNTPKCPLCIHGGNAFPATAYGGQPSARQPGPRSPLAGRGGVRQNRLLFQSVRGW